MAEWKQPGTFPSLQLQGAAPMPAALEAHGGNVLRMVFWLQCAALSESLGSMLATDARDWQKRFGISAEQRAALTVYLALTVPQLVDIFLAHHHDKWFEQTFTRSI